MIILYDSDEREFTTLGLGVLRDVISCEVTEELNGIFEVSVDYPISGNHYSDIGENKIMLIKANPYDDNGQPFRIYKITKPIDGVVNILAQHISYDMSGYTVEPFDGTDLDDTLSKIQNGTIIPAPFTLIRGQDKTNVQTEFKIEQPYSQRSLLAGSDETILNVYKGEFEFDRFNVILHNHRGSDRGVRIRYGKNMTSGEQELNFEKTYTAVYPYYASHVSETITEQTDVYEQVYIVEGQTPLSINWLSQEPGPNNKPLLPILQNSPVQIATEGEYFGRIFIWKSFPDLETGGEFLRYAEVTDQAEDYPPTRKETVTREEERYEYVVLPEKVIYINENSVRQNILTLDLTSNFDSIPTEEELRNRANQYISDNKIGEIKDSIKVSFIKLSDSPEYSQFKNLETVKLGDYVQIEYEELGISTKLQVISYNYNPLTNLYTEIELGTKQSTLSDTVVTEGDNVSALTNDKGYTDRTTVNELIAKTVTADYILALNAEFTQAQISELLTADTIRTRMIEASQFDIDYLVAEKLVAQDAEVYNQLIAGNIKVRGDIDILSGSITITGNPETIDAYINADSTIEPLSENWLCSDEEGLIPIVHESGPSPFYIVKTLGDYYGNIYRYFDDNYIEWTDDTTFAVDQYGNVHANSVEIEGYIKAIAGDIGGCKIIDGVLEVDGANISGTLEAVTIDSSTIIGSEIKIGEISPDNYHFSVDDSGFVKITDGSIQLGAPFTPDQYTNAYIIENSTPFTSGWLTLTEGSSTPLQPQDNMLYRVYYNRKYRFYYWNTDIYLEKQETYISIDDDGKIYAQEVEFDNGTINNLDYMGATEINASEMLISDVLEVANEIKLSTDVSLTAQATASGSSILQQFGVDFLYSIRSGAEQFLWIMEFELYNIDFEQYKDTNYGYVDIEVKISFTVFNSSGGGIGYNERRTVSFDTTKSYQLIAIRVYNDVAPEGNRVIVNDIRINKKNEQWNANLVPILQLDGSLFLRVTNGLFVENIGTEQEPCENVYVENGRFDSLYIKIGNNYDDVRNVSPYRVWGGTIDLNSGETDYALRYTWTEATVHHITADSIRSISVTERDDPTSASARERNYRAGYDSTGVFVHNTATVSVKFYVIIVYWYRY